MTLSRRTLLASIAGAFALGASPGLADSALPSGLDTDADGTVDLPEAKKAAEAPRAARRLRLSRLRITQ
jgi:hypothetical protein